MKLFTTIFLIFFSQIVISQTIPKIETKGLWMDKEYIDSVVKYHSMGKYVYDRFIKNKCNYSAHKLKLFLLNKSKNVDKLNSKKCISSLKIKVFF